MVQLHVEHPTLGAGSLAQLLLRVHQHKLSRETVRKILKRSGPAIREAQRGAPPTARSLAATHPGQLWAIDVSLVWRAGYFPLWVVAVLDHHGSYLVQLQPIAWPSGPRVAQVLRQALAGTAAPLRILTDRGSEFRSQAFRALTRAEGIVHTFTKPHHPWTNGRVERLFRTFKTTVHGLFWLVPSNAAWAHACTEFRLFYNEHRPHQSFGGRTPHEVRYGLSQQPAGPRRTFFNGRLNWWDMQPAAPAPALAVQSPHQRG